MRRKKGSEKAGVRVVTITSITAILQQWSNN